MQDHAADQLNIEVPHVQNATSRFPHNRKGFRQDFIENIFEGLVAIGIQLLDSIRVSSRLGRETAQPFL